MELLNTNQLIQEITKGLHDLETSDLQDIAQRVLGGNVEFIGNDEFEVSNPNQKPDARNTETGEAKEIRHVTTTRILGVRKDGTFILDHIE
jgi:hypothetical protein